MAGEAAAAAEGWRGCRSGRPGGATVPDFGSEQYATHRSPATLPAAIAPQHVGAGLHSPKLRVLRGGKLPDAINCVWAGRQPAVCHCDETAIWQPPKMLRYWLCAAVMAGGWRE